jgi:hypothetical protein
MNNRIYLDNCCFNRPYDDQTILRNYLEAEAKTYIQLQIEAVPKLQFWNSNLGFTGKSGL